MKFEDVNPSRHEAVTLTEEAQDDEAIPVSDEDILEARPSKQPPPLRKK